MVYVMLKKIALVAIIMSVSTTVNANSSAVVINDLSSGYQTYAYNNPAIQNVETHIIGVYETRSDSSFGYHPEGTAFVHVSGSASTPVNLVLSSYEPTKWVLDGEGLSFISSVLINGYNLSRVVGVDSSIIINRTGSTGYISACGYVWPSDNQGCDTLALVNGVESIYDTKVSTFTGDYRATNFSLTLSPVPEVSSIYMLSLGLLSFVFYRRRYL